MVDRSVQPNKQVVALTPFPPNRPTSRRSVYKKRRHESPEDIQPLFHGSGCHIWRGAVGFQTPDHAVADDGLLIAA